MYQTGQTIVETLNQIHRHDLVLPAIQREFVWGEDQIYTLFDSLMQGYPFGTFLYWKVASENSGKFNFYDFVREYHERDNRHCPQLPEMSNQPLTAVLDGQQRLTALNIGLRGSMAKKLPRLWWNNPDAFPVHHLHLDLLWQPENEDEEGSKYRFSFRTSGQSGSEQECWFRVRDIMSMDGGPPMVEWLTGRGLEKEKLNLAYKTLDKLYTVVHKEHLVAFYEETGQELDKVLQIFIRMNDGGTALSHSDLLLSIAVAQWGQHDAREEVHDLVDDLNNIGEGFSFSKDLVLKAGLMLSDIGSVGFKVDNFNRDNMSVFEAKWDRISDALKLTVQLVADFGFNRQNLTAHNAILPIAYYLYRKNPNMSYLTHSSFSDDRIAIREWLTRSLLKAGVWGSGMDTLLTALRQVIRDSESDSYPVDKIREEMASRGRTLSFEDEEIEGLADMRYGNRLTFALLSFLVPSVDLKNKFHVDHIFPASRFTRQKLIQAGVPQDKAGRFAEMKDGLANLQLLSGPVNIEKQATMPAEWFLKAYPNPSSRMEYQDLHFLGEIPTSILEFESFYEARRNSLMEAIKRILGK